MQQQFSHIVARYRPLVIIALLVGVLAFLAWYVRPDGKLKVMFLETGGDAVLIQTPAGGYVLLDGGSDPAVLAAALGQRMPFWLHTLDAVILTAPDAARLPGQAAALTRYHLNQAIIAPAAHTSALFNEWRRLVQAADVPVHIAQTGEVFGLGGAQLRVLALGSGKSAGMLLRLEYGATSVVFDQNGLDSDVPQHQANLLAFPWELDPHAPVVSAFHPQAIVFTDGEQAAHPAELTFRERAIGGARLYHERLNGAITWATDGQQSWITTER